LARPDQIFLSGNVLTMDPEIPQASAFAVCGDRFYAVGSDSEIRKVSGEGTKAVDLGGKTVIPGFIETHNHLSDYAMTLLQANCAIPPNRTIYDVLARIKKATSKKASGQWVRGWGYDDTLIAVKHYHQAGITSIHDGSIQALTAALMKPYYEKPDFRGSRLTLRYFQVIH